MLENIQHLLNGLEAGAFWWTRETHRHEKQQNQTTPRDVHEDYTDNEAESQGLSTDVLKKATQSVGPVLIKKGKRLTHITLGLSHDKLTKP